MKNNYLIKQRIKNPNAEAIKLLENAIKSITLESIIIKNNELVTDEDFDTLTEAIEQVKNAQKLLR